MHGTCAIWHRAARISRVHRGAPRGHDPIARNSFIFIPAFLLHPRRLLRAWLVRWTLIATRESLCCVEDPLLQTITSPFRAWTSRATRRILPTNSHIRDKGKRARYWTLFSRISTREWCFHYFCLLLWKQLRHKVRRQAERWNLFWKEIAAGRNFISAVSRILERFCYFGAANF